MKALSKIWLPLGVTLMIASGAFGMVRPMESESESDSQARDTVIYPYDSFKKRRVGDFQEISIVDTLSGKFAADTMDVNDSLPRLRARDTLIAPDSLKLIDPFRFKYYAALLDSFEHVFTRDSLLASVDTLRAHEMFEQAALDSADRFKLDSLYIVDSTFRAKAAFLAWYNSLDKDARKKYDFEQKEKRKMAVADSISEVKEAEKAHKDSILNATPRILESYFIPDSLQYKRFIAWQVDQDFHKIKAEEPDTSFNYHFYDYPFLREDVNATWLGVSGSPAQYYNYFKRSNGEGVDFYKAYESWSVNPSTVKQYNTKTPHTELCYTGTLMSSRSKESDNLHLFTTQNVSPEFNFGLLYDRFGGGGFLENEKTVNKTEAVTLNYLGKQYMMNSGFIHNKISMGENGGILDNFWIRDTVGIDSREIDVALKDASSLTKKTTFFMDQQYRIPLDFLDRLKAGNDSTLTEPLDTVLTGIADGSQITDSTDVLNRDVTTAFIGHSSEYTNISRQYNDGSETRMDSLSYTKFENKVFIRLQPWAQDAFVSKLNIGIGDLFEKYGNFSMETPVSHTENSVYGYAGIEGNIREYFEWQAKGKMNVLGDNLGDFDITADGKFNFYPFRKAKKSPVSVGAHFEAKLQSPDWFQENLVTNHYNWTYSLSKIGSSTIGGDIDIPKWKFDASVNYGILSGNTYYGTDGAICQNYDAMSVLSAYLRKDLVIGGLLHLDNRVLLQYSSNQEVLPLPTASLNLKYFVEFVAQKAENGKDNVLVMQIGANAFYNTKWYSPAWNTALGVFQNQTEILYNNGPYFDVFINMQWKKACIFVKYQNFMRGWPMDRPDYFSAHHHIVSQDGVDGLKIGIWWPFYTSSEKSHGNGANGGGRK